jgi:sugar phosphate permease
MLTMPGFPRKPKGSSPDASVSDQSNTKRLAVFALLVFGVLFLLSEAQRCFGGSMAKIIEFYIPQSFRKVSKWFPPAERGKVLAFPLAVRKSA